MNRAMLLLLFLIGITFLAYCQRESGPVGPSQGPDPVPDGEWTQYAAGGGMYGYQGFVRNKGSVRADSVRVILSWPALSISDSAYVDGLTFVTTSNETSFASINPGQVAPFELITRGKGTGWRMNIHFSLFSPLEGTLVSD